MKDNTRATRKNTRKERQARKDKKGHTIKERQERNDKKENTRKYGQ